MGARFILLATMAALALGCAGCRTREKVRYADGGYEAETRSKYEGEAYYGIAKVSIAAGKVESFDFKIVDKNLDEAFDKDYERHYSGNGFYLRQCENDLAGIEAYTAQFRKTRDLDSVQAITGATWSYDLFTDAMKAALLKAKVRE